MKMRVASGGIQTHETLYSGKMLYQMSYQGNSVGRVRMKHLICLYEQANLTCTCKYTVCNVLCCFINTVLNYYSNIIILLYMYIQYLTKIICSAHTILLQEVTRPSNLHVCTAGCAQNLNAQCAII